MIIMEKKNEKNEKIDLNEDELYKSIEKFSSVADKLQKVFSSLSIAVKNIEKKIENIEDHLESLDEKKKEEE